MNERLRTRGEWGALDKTSRMKGGSLPHAGQSQLSSETTARISEGVEKIMCLAREGGHMEWLKDR